MSSGRSFGRILRGPLRPALWAGSVLLVSSPTDERCPADQVRRYADALTDRGVRCETFWVGGGHHSRDSADHAAVMDRMLRFATDVLPPVPGRVVRSGRSGDDTREGGDP